MIGQYKTLIDNLLKDLPQKSQDVLSRRIGFNGKKETLEAIGKDYNITRERVRQIEKKAIETIKKSPKFSKVKEPILKIKSFIEINGGLKREDILELNLTKEKKEKPYLDFLLKIGDPFFYHPDSPELYSLWKTKNEAPDYAKILSDFLVKLMEKERKLFGKEELLEIAVKEAPKVLRMKIKREYANSYIEATKKIEENPFGLFGPSHWPEVTPKGVRDEAYLVLKKEGRPLHFNDLAKEIEKNLKKTVNPNTLHNELIKNSQFVLIGRGIYALREWGYEDGTVKDMIEKILDARGPLTKEEIIKEVKKIRMVKESTIYLNLGNFKKNKEGKYIL
jgi:DNA-directed RNA polymerase delta subunit